MTYLRHITLTTGHARDSLPGEVSDEVVARLIPAVRCALRGWRVPVPADVEPPGCTLTAGATGRCISVTVWAPRRRQSPRTPAPIAEIGVAVHSRCGARLWRSLHDLAQRTDAPIETDRKRCPSEPWVAALLYPSAMHYQEAMHWLGDFERCVGWAWLREGQG